MKPTFTVILLIISCAIASAQVTLTGQVIDRSGEGIPGITIQIKGTNHGVSSDIQGKYRITGIYSGKVTLLFTGVGFQQMERELDLRKSMRLEPVQMQESTTELNAVQVVGKSEAAMVREQSFAVSSIDVKPLQNLNMDVNQVLAKSTGVRIRENGGLGSGFQFSLNGFSGNQVRFFLDGVPMENFGSSLTLNNLPVNVAERIEIYEGVVPVWLGSDALGGAVNIVTNQGTQNYLDASYSYGSFNTHRISISGAYTDEKTGFTVRANMFQNYSDNSYRVKVNKKEGSVILKEKVEQERFHDGYDSKSALVDIGFVNKSFADQLLLGMIVSGAEKEQQTGATMEKVYGQRLRKTSTVMPTLRYRKSDLFIEGLELNGFASYNFGYIQTIDTTSRTYFWDGSYAEKADPTDGELNRTIYKFEDNALITRANLSYIVNENHSLVLNYTQNRINRSGHDEANPLELSNREPKKVTKLVLGVGYKFDWKKKLTASLFAKNYRLDGATFYTINPYTTRERIERSLHQSQLGFGSAFSYHIKDNLQLKGSVEQAYRMPEANELFGDGANVTGNAQLKPESSTNYNIGALYEISPGLDHTLNLETNLLLRQVDNYIRPSVGTSDPTSTFTNEAAVNVHGFEGTFRYAYRSLLRFSGNVTYQVQRNAVEMVDGKENPLYKEQIPNQPYLFANANLMFNFRDLLTDADKLGLGYGASFYEEYDLYWSKYGGSSGKYIIPRQFSHNIDINYSIKNGRYNMSLTCNNLFDAELYDNFRLQKPGRAYYVKLRYFIFK